METNGGPLPAGLSRPAQQALEAAGIRSLEEAARRTEGELLKLHGFGPASIRLLRPALEERGLAFKGQQVSPKKGKGESGCPE
ncbi:hypothetical protein [Cohnella hongkongensis]|uniref:DNA-binding protein n=1 Tax=Cohnella hongkongensis TaxID=178337 RepID=A0ABV9FI91_9BACL